MKLLCLFDSEAKRFEAAEGTTEISEIYHIERGYSQFVEKLRGIGADIRRVD